MQSTNLAIKADQQPQPTSYILLTKADIPAFLELQAKVIAALPEDKKHFLKGRTAEDLAAHLDDNMPIIALKDHDGKIIAQELVTLFSSAAAKHLEGYPNIGEEPKAVVQSVQVDPDHRGNKLVEVLLNAAITEATNMGCASLLAKTATANKSKDSFISVGFEEAATGEDLKQGYEATYFQVALAKSEPSLQAV